MSTQSKGKANINMKKKNGKQKSQRQRPRQAPSRSMLYGGSTSVGAATAYARQQKPGAPVMTYKKGGCRISHRELVTTVNGSVSFTAIKFACNPGLPTTFPWLATIAQNWEQYTFRKLNFEYITRTATTTIGSVILAPDYDAADAAPASESAVSSYQGVCEDVPWRDICCELDPSSMHAIGPRKFVRVGLVGGDIKTYDVANFYLCTTEETGATSIGKLWVDYDVEFYVPQIQPAASSGPTYTSQYGRHASQTLTTGVPAVINWDTTYADGLGIGAGSSGTFTPVEGNYLVNAMVSYQDTSSEAFTVSVSIFKNGAAVTGYSSILGPVTVSANGKLSCSVSGVLNMTGTDTFSIVGSLIGAAGTLTVVPDYSQLTISSA